MKTPIAISLRSTPSGGASFTLPIQRKSLPLTLYPMSLKKISLISEKRILDREEQSGFAGQGK